jgi:hypothetical protein
MINTIFYWKKESLKDKKGNNVGILVVENTRIELIN